MGGTEESMHVDAGTVRVFKALYICLKAVDIELSLTFVDLLRRSEAERYYSR